MTSELLAGTAFFMRREVRRAAWFLWMTPLDAALPRRFCARRTASAASSAPVSIAVVGGLDPRSSARSARPCCGRAAVSF